MKYPIIKWIRSKVEQAVRLVFVNSLTPINNSILIVEYPKSGGTWLGQLVSDYFQLPFPRNRFPVIRRSVFHSHYLPKWRIPKNKKILFLVRDGRDVIVSLYYHQLIWNDKNRLNPKDVFYHRSQTAYDDFEDVRGNMNDFIRYTYTERPSKFQQFTYMGNWYSFNKAWLDESKKPNSNIYLITYEDLLEDTYGTMYKMLHDFFGIKEIETTRLKETVHKYSFENQTKRKKGEEKKNSFLRKGIRGDWKNYFGEHEKQSMKKYTKDLLVELGYEQSQNW